ncbi:telomere repeats-binding bouquet formation protein 1 [Aquarana catesbeiana]|uniref:telomere repeats-binding bouquet formation protein 1 n=1 Tax=Aquarana catesbeiana TaxID=8400 RepID=UPI003CC9D231
MKTDLKLLLECLKYEMDNPELQKETLVAIRSICQNNSDACEYFREIGGLLFIVSLVRSSTHLTLKEISFYTLGILAESNVFCQQTLCIPELFKDVSIVLSDDRSSVSFKRISVFLLLVLVSNNKAGQVFVRESGCIDLLLLLFSSSGDPRYQPWVESGDPRYQLWLSVCSALSACVNNPQNEENQKLCSSAFPRAEKYLQHSLRPEIVRPVCSLIGLSVANNRFSQDCFLSVGGLDTLAKVLLQLVTNVQTRGMDSMLAVVVSKTLDACIAENRGAVRCLSQYGVVSSLIALLAHRSLNPEDRFSIVLTLGHCTEDCEPNQYELLRGNGLPLMIQILTESQDDETHKAATFVLQNCRHTTEMLSLSEETPNPEQAAAWKIPENRHDEFWEKAKEIYRKIEYLQQQHNEDIANMEEPEGSRDRSPHRRPAANAVFTLPFINSHSNQQRNDPSLVGSNQRLLEKRNDPSLVGSNQRLLEKSLVGSNQRLLEKRNDPSLVGSNQRLLEKRNDPSLVGSNQRLLEKRNDPSLVGSNQRLLEKSNKPAEKLQNNPPCAGSPMCRDRSYKSDSFRKNPSSKHAATQTAEHHMTDLQPYTELVEEGKQTNPRRHSPSNSRSNAAGESPSIRRRMNTDPMSLCAEIISEEISSVLRSHISQARLRCSGCLVTGLSMNSRNCSNILQKCPHLCDNHRIVLQTEERYKAELRKLLSATRIYTPHNSFSLTPLRTGRKEAGQSLQRERLPHGILLKPIRKRLEEEEREPKRLEEEERDPKRLEEEERDPKRLEEEERDPKRLEEEERDPKRLEEEERDPKRLEEERNPKRLEEERDPAYTERFPQLRKSDLNLEHRKESPGIIQEMINNEIESTRDQGESLRNSDLTNPRRAIRKDFTGKEIADLLDGVRKFGHHWNAILWSYPFQRGRRNVDLAKKYKQLQVLQTCDDTEQ